MVYLSRFLIDDRPFLRHLPDEGLMGRFYDVEVQRHVRPLLVVPFDELVQAVEFVDLLPDRPEEPLYLPVGLRVMDPPQYLPDLQSHQGLLELRCSSLPLLALDCVEL